MCTYNKYCYIKLSNNDDGTQKYLLILHTEDDELVSRIEENKSQFKQSFSLFVDHLISCPLLYL